MLCHFCRSFFLKPSWVCGFRNQFLSLKGSLDNLLGDSTRTFLFGRGVSRKTGENLTIHWFNDSTSRGDGGEFVVPQFNVAPEATISTTNYTNNTVTNESCAVWVTRQGISSGRAGLNVTVEPCAISFPQMSESCKHFNDQDFLQSFPLKGQIGIGFHTWNLENLGCGRHFVLDHCKDLADYGQDYLKAPQQEPLMWESDESGRKCLIGILSEKVPVGFAGRKDGREKRLEVAGNWETCRNCTSFTVGVTTVGTTHDRFEMISKRMHHWGQFQVEKCSSHLELLCCSTDAMPPRLPKTWSSVDWFHHLNKHGFGSMPMLGPHGFEWHWIHRMIVVLLRGGIPIWWPQKDGMFIGNHHHDKARGFLMFLYMFYIWYLYHIFIYTTHVFVLGGRRDGGDAAQHLPEDGQVEQDEAICWKATLAPDSTASLTNERFFLRLDDSGLDGGGKLRCVRGRECTQDATEWGIGALYHMITVHVIM